MKLKLPASCWYCGVSLTPTVRPPFKRKVPYPRTMATWDHVLPRVMSGKTGAPSKEDCVPACLNCNETKGLLSLEEFRIVIGFRRNAENWHSGGHRFHGELFGAF